MDGGSWHRRLIGALLVSCLAATAAAEQPSLKPLAALELRDLRGGTDSLAAHRGRPVVVMVVDARRLRTLKVWERDLRGRFGDLDYLRIADVPREPPTTYERVAEKLAQRVPEEVQVLIDMNGFWSTTLGLDTSRPNLLLMRADGTLAAAFEGRHDPQLAATVAAEVERLAADR